MADETWNSVGGQAQIGNLVQAGHIGAVHLHGSPEPAVVPREFPAEIAHFEDREEEQALVFRAAREWEGQRRERPLVVGLSGLGGVGKTELGFLLAR